MQSLRTSKPSRPVEARQPEIPILQAKCSGIRVEPLSHKPPIPRCKPPNGTIPGSSQVAGQAHADVERSEDECGARSAAFCAQGRLMNA